jgi:hypothetical protein
MVSPDSNSPQSHPQEDGINTHGIELFEVIKRNDLSMLHEILMDGDYEINDPTPEGVTPLICAIFHGSPQMVEVLIKHGADVNAPLPANNLSPMFFASPDLAKLRLILAAGADVSHLDHAGHDVLDFHVATQGGLDTNFLAMLVEYKFPFLARDAVRASVFPRLLQVYLARPPHTRDLDAFKASIAALAEHSDINGPCKDLDCFRLDAAGYMDPRNYPPGSETFARFASLLLLFGMNVHHNTARALREGGEVTNEMFDYSAIAHAISLGARVAPEDAPVLLSLIARHDDVHALEHFVAAGGDAFAPSMAGLPLPHLCLQAGAGAVLEALCTLSRAQADVFEGSPLQRCLADAPVSPLFMALLAPGATPLTRTLAIHGVDPNATVDVRTHHVSMIYTRPTSILTLSPPPPPPGPR